MTIHWTGVKHLICPDNVHDQVRIVQALFYCGTDSECYNTVVSKCILRFAWEKIKWNYNITVFIDFWFLFLPWSQLLLHDL